MKMVIRKMKGEEQQHIIYTVFFWRSSLLNGWRVLVESVARFRSLRIQKLFPTSALASPVSPLLPACTVCLIKGLQNAGHELITG